MRNDLNVWNIRSNFCRRYVRATVCRDLRLFAMNDSRLVRDRDARDKVIRVKARKANLIDEPSQANRGAKAEEVGDYGFVHCLAYRATNHRVSFAAVVLRVVVYRKSTLHARDINLSGVHSHDRVPAVGLPSGVQANRARRVVISDRRTKRVTGAFSPRVFLVRSRTLGRYARYAIRRRCPFLGCLFRARILVIGGGAWRPVLFFGHLPFLYLSLFFVVDVTSLTCPSRSNLLFPLASTTCQALFFRNANVCPA